ncbi:MAG: Hpt domain-containing protein, partial [Candidatus Adiutrix sp.]|nr:Hpt domain-containing protein [Candidatus Adiutrix sp.]
MSEDLLSEFIFDSRDHLGTAGTQLLELEKNPGSLDSLNALMGTMHTIKGNSGFLDLKNLYKLMHHAESLLQTIREKKSDCPQTVIDLLLQVLDTVEAILNRLENGENDAVDWLGALNQALSETESKLEGGPDQPPAADPAPAAEPGATAAPTPAEAALPENLTGRINFLPLADGSLTQEGEIFPAKVEAMFQAGLAGLVVDLRDLGRLTNPELKVLMAAGQKKPESTAFLLNFKKQAALYRIFQLLRLDHFMHFCADQAAALAYLKREA